MLMMGNVFGIFAKVFSGFFGLFGSILGAIFSVAGVLIGLVIGIGLLIFRIVCRVIIFKKMGEPGIYAVIPIYNDWVLYRNTLGSGLFMLLLLVPIVRYAIAIIQGLEMAKVFGKSELLGIILFAFPPLGEAILAFTDAEYHGLRSRTYIDEIVDWFKRA